MDFSRLLEMIDFWGTIKKEPRNLRYDFIESGWVWLRNYKLNQKCIFNAGK